MMRCEYYVDILKKASFIIILLLILTTPAILAQGTTDIDKVQNATLTDEMIVMLILIVLLMLLFFFEPISIDLIALSVPVILIVLSRWTKITLEEAISGFANKATITVLAMFIISAGIQQSGIIQVLGRKIADITGSNHYRQVGFITGISGFIAGLLNNTPVVATLIPMVNDIAAKTKTSPSKLLIPLSYASMMGGMIVLIGHKLIPDRIKPTDNLFDEYEMREYLTEVVIEERSPLINKTLDDFKKSTGMDLDIFLLSRRNNQYIVPSFQK